MGPQISSKITTLLLAMLTLVPQVAMGGRKTPASSAGYSVVIWQDGKQRPNVGGQVTLKRRPFKIVLTLLRGHGALVNASQGRTLYDRARSKQSLTDQPGLGGGSGMAEASYNPDQELWISKTGSHYLYANEKRKDHRFDRVAHRGDHFVGYRTVAKVRRIHKKEKPTTLKRWAGRDLYLVFLVAPYDAKRSTNTERWRAALRLQFR